MATSISKTSVAVGMDASAFKTGAEGLKSYFKDIGASAGKLVGVLGLASLSFAGIKAGIEGSLGKVIAFEKTQAILEAIGKNAGDSESSVANLVGTLSTITGRNDESGKALGDMARKMMSIGFSAAETEKMVNSFYKAAKASPAEIGETYSTLEKMALNLDEFGFVSLKQYKAVAQLGIPIMEILAKKISEMRGVVVTAEEVAAQLKLSQENGGASGITTQEQLIVLSGLGDSELVQAQIAAVGNTFAGSMKKSKEEISLMFFEIGKAINAFFGGTKTYVAIFKTITAGVKAAREQVELLGSVFANNQQWIDDFKHGIDILVVAFFRGFEVMGEQLMESKVIVGQWFNSFVENIPAIENALGGFFNSAIGMASDFFSSIGSGFNSAISGIRGIFTNTISGGVGLITGSLSMVGGLFVSIAGGFKSLLNTLTFGLSNALGGFFNSAIGMASDFFSSIGSGFNSAISGIRGIFTNTISGGVGLITGSLSMVGGLFVSIAGGFKSLLNTLTFGLSNALGGFFNSAIGMASDFFSSIGSGFNSAISGIRGIFTNTISGGVGLITGSLSMVGGLFVSIAGGFKSLLNTLTFGLSNALGGFFNSAIGMASDFFSSIGSGFNSAISGIRGIFTNTISGGVGLITGSLSMVGGLFVSIAGGFKSLLNTLTFGLSNALGGFFNSAIGMASDFFSSIGSGFNSAISGIRGIFTNTISGGVGLITGSLSMVGGLFVSIAGGFKSLLNTLTFGLSNALGGFFNSAIGMASDFFSSIGSGFNSAISGIRGIFTNTISGGVGLITGSLSMVGGLFVSIAGGFKSLLNTLTFGLSNALGGFFNSAIGMASDFFSSIGSGFNSAISGIRGIFTNTISGGVGLITGSLSMVGGLFVSIAGGFKSLLNTLTFGLSNALGGFFNSAIGMASDFFSSIGSGFNSAISGIRGIFTNTISGGVGLITGSLSMVGGLFVSIAGGFKSLLNTLTFGLSNALGGFAASVMKFTGWLTARFFEACYNIFKGLAGFVGSGIAYVVSGFASLFGKIVSGLASVIGSVVKPVVKFAGWIGAKFFEAFYNIFKGLLNFITFGFSNKVINSITGIASSMARAFTDVVSSVTSAISGSASAIGGFFTSATKPVSDTTGAIKGMAKATDTGTERVSYMQLIFKGFGEYMTDFASNFEAIFEVWNVILDSFGDGVINVTNIWEGMYEILQTIKTAAQVGFLVIYELGVKSINGILKVFEDMAAFTTKWVDKFSYGLSSILESIGLVSKGTTDAMMAQDKARGNVGYNLGRFDSVSPSEARQNIQNQAEEERRARIKMYNERKLGLNKDIPNAEKPDFARGKGGAAGAQLAAPTLLTAGGTDEYKLIMERNNSKLMKGADKTNDLLEQANGHLEQIAAAPRPTAPRNNTTTLIASA